MIPTSCFDETRAGRPLPRPGDIVRDFGCLKVGKPPIVCRVECVFDWGLRVSALHDPAHVWDSTDWSALWLEESGR
jgi:hypothetical protein